MKVERVGFVQVTMGKLLKTLLVFTLLTIGMSPSDVKAEKLGVLALVMTHPTLKLPTRTTLTTFALHSSAKNPMK